jgi:hypothetical protein
MAISIPIVTEFNGAGIEKAKREFAQLEGAGKKAQYAIKKAAIPAAAALAGVGAALFDATKGAIEDAAAQDALANNLRKTTFATDAQIASVEDWISTQGQLLGITDDELRPAFQRLARATGDITEAQKLASQAMDIAAATGKPLNTVIGALEKAYGGNLAALGKLAPEYRQLIKDGSTFEEVMALLAKTTGGAAAEAANTTAGKFARLKLQMDETKESIGASLIPVVEAALPVLQKFGDWAAKNPETFTKMAGAISAVAAATVAVNAAMATNPYVLAAAGIVALALAFERLAQALEKMNKLGGLAARLLAVFMKVPSIGLLQQGLSPFLKDENPYENLPLTRIPAMANGGIVNSSTLALIGEAGPEAVIPLDRMGDIGGGGNNVTINVNGGDPNAVVSALRTYMRQNGSVPIRVSNIY